MSVKAELIKKAYEAKNRIEKAVNEIGASENEVESIWNNYVPSSKPDLILGAVDGSRNYKEFLGYTVYAIASSSSLFYGGKIVNGWESYIVDVDILKPQEFSESRLTMLMGIIEAKEAIRAIRDGKTDYILLDGSFIGNVIRPAVFSFELSTAEKEKLHKMFEELKKYFSTDKISSKSFHEKIYKDFEKRKFPAACGYLEYLEYLYSQSELILNFRDKIISISKTSTSRLYEFESILPDIAVLNKLNLEPGYSKPLTVKMDREIKRGFPEIFEDIFRKLELKVSYVKFREFGNVYKVETALEPERIMDILEPYIVSGYPYPLKKAHDDVKISKDDMETVISILSTKGKTGREGVDEQTIR